MFAFPFKITTSMDLLMPFTKFITEKFGPDSLALFTPKIEELQKIRNKFDFSKTQAQISHDYRLGEDLEKNLIRYLQLLYFIDHIFYRNIIDPSSGLALMFAWTDTFNPQPPPGISNTKYEIASVLYNLILTYYTTANTLSIMHEEETQLKAIAKLRCALWCLREIKHILIEIMPGIKVPISDLNTSYLTMFEHLILAQSYSIFSRMLIDKKADLAKLAGAQTTAAKEFKQALDILTINKPVPQQLANSLRLLFDYSLIYYKSQSYLSIMFYHLAKKDEDILGGHVGLALSYVKAAKTDIEIYISKNPSYSGSTPDTKEEINKILGIITQNYNYCTEQNRNVYKQEEFTSEKLHVVESDKKSILPLEPKDLKKKFDDEDSFEIYTKPELLVIRNELQALVFLKVNSFYSGLKQIQAEKERKYMEVKVYWLLGLFGYQQKMLSFVPEDPNSLEWKIKEFQDKGGLLFAEDTKSEIKGLREDIEISLKVAMKKLELEQQRDNTARELYGNQWNKKPSAELNKILFEKVGAIESVLNQTQEPDKKLKDKYDYLYDDIMEFSQRDSMITMTGKEPLLPEDILLSLGELDKLDKKLIQLLNDKDIEAKLVEFRDYFGKTDFTQNLKKINEDPMIKDQEFEAITLTLTELVNRLNSQLQEAKQLIDQIYNLAKSIIIPPSKPIIFTQNDLMENKETLSKIHGLFSDLNTAKDFYTKLKPYADALKSAVSQYCDLRDNQLLTVSKIIDPTSSNPLVTEENPYKTVEESIKPKEDPDYQQLTNEELDLGAKWTSIKLTKSFFIEADPNTLTPAAKPPGK